RVAGRQYEVTHLRFADGERPNFRGLRRRQVRVRYLRDRQGRAAVVDVEQVVPGHVVGAGADVGGDLNVVHARNHVRQLHQVGAAVVHQYVGGQFVAGRIVHGNRRVEPGAAHRRDGHDHGPGLAVRGGPGGDTV